MSLRARLLVGLAVLVLLGLVAADVATYKALESFLNQQVDVSLAGIHQEVARQLHFSPDGGDQGPGGSPGLFVGPGVYGALLGPEGTILAQTSTSPHPILPAHLRAAGMTQDTVLTVPGTGSVDHYRVLLDPGFDAGAQGNLLVVAIPLTAVEGTLATLMRLEVGVGLAVLVLMLAVAWWMIRLGLRPLERMGATAQAIAAGDLSRRVAVTSARTEVGRLGLALNSMLAQIEQAFAERTESNRRLRRFVADASHELRTPLTSIRGYAELFRRGAIARPDEVAASMQRIEDEAKRMGGLVDDLLLLARLDQGRPLERVSVDLARLAADAGADARAVDPARTLTVQAPRPVVVIGDELRLRQVVANLIRNALVHTPPASPIEIVAEVQSGQAAVIVRDHGPGLPPGDAERIFEPFYRADSGRSRDRGGSGLGLSIVASVVAAHGGSISASDTPGGGATFRVDLPLAPESAALAATA